jgi:hypothetical protein
MAIKAQQLRQSVLISGGGTAVLIVAVVAWLTSSRVGQVLEQQADVRGRDVATRGAAIVTQYLKERRREVVALASLPQLVTLVRQAGQDAVSRGLDRVPVPELEQTFSATRQLGGDPRTARLSAGLRQQHHLRSVGDHRDGEPWPGTFSLPAVLRTSCSATRRGGRAPKRIVRR